MSSRGLKKLTDILGIVLLVFSLIFGIYKNNIKITLVFVGFILILFLYFSFFTKPWNLKENSLMEEFISLFKILFILFFVGLFVIYINGFENSKIILGFLLFLFVFINVVCLLFLKKISKSLKNKIFRIAKEKDIKEILQIYLDGSNALKKDKVDQWQDEYVPSIKDVEKHFGKDLYVLEIKEQIVATACLVEGIDEDYENIKGTWHTKSPYISIHKVATKEAYKNKGFGKIMMNEIYEIAKEKKKDLRIDTHKDNKKMIKFIKSCGYTYAGEVILNGKLKRLAYDRKYKEIEIKEKENKNNEKIERPLRCG